MNDQRELNLNPQVGGDLDVWVAELRGAALAMEAVADRLAALFNGSSGGSANSSASGNNSEPSTADRAQTEPTATKPEPPNLEQVRAVLAEKSRAGHTAEVRALLQKHGAKKLSEIDPAHYPALIAEGSQIGQTVSNHG